MKWAGIALAALVGLSLQAAGFGLVFVEPVVTLPAAAGPAPGAPAPPVAVSGPGQPGNPFGRDCPHPPVSQGFGPSTLQLEPPVHGFSHFHGGIDLACPYGTLVRDIDYEGVAHVTLSGVGYGNHVDVEFQAPQGHFWIRYAHLSAVAVSDGSSVQVGDLLGWEGSTGASTGPHLHFGVYLNAREENDTVDPIVWLAL
jgi:murein DD-endopeptidase MepM/ murein hydrolase activator NlpD